MAISASMTSPREAEPSEDLSTEAPVHASPFPALPPIPSCVDGLTTTPAELKTWEPARLLPLRESGQSDCRLFSLKMPRTQRPLCSAPVVQPYFCPICLSQEDDHPKHSPFVVSLFFLLKTI